MMVVQVPEVGDDVRHKDGISDGGDDRPKRSSKPNPKYNPDVYDLSYVGVRKRSRRSIHRADNYSEFVMTKQVCYGHEGRVA